MLMSSLYQEFPEYNQRCHGHDYYGPFIYHIILKKQPKCPIFGKIKGDCSIPVGNYGSPYVARTPLGKIIRDALQEWSAQYTFIKLWQYSIMPDHVHLLINKAERTEEHLSFFIKKLKFIIRDRYNATIPQPITANDIFQESYCDKPLFQHICLDTLFRYIELNPHRLAARIQRPEFFERVNNLLIDGQTLQSYGNMFFLDNPDKYAVRISRSYSEEEQSKLRHLWLSETIKGSILVSPFISPKEKNIMREANEFDGKFILIQHEAFGPRFKPSGHLFKLCEEGRLLIISLGLAPKTPLSKALCIRMNALAEHIASRNFR